MNLQAILILILLITLSPLLIQCSNVFSQKTELPAEMPADTEIGFYEGGGMLPTFKRVKISGNLLFIEERLFNDKEPKSLYAEISAEETAALYKAFVENKFDRIKNDKREAIVYDAPSENVSIRAGRKTYNISAGMNSPLSGSNQKRYENVRNAILKLEAKYRDQSKPLTRNFAVIKYDESPHKWIFKFSKPARLEKEELAQIDRLVSRAVREYNSKQKANRQIKDLGKYKFQYIPVYNKAGAKEVWVNAFCDAFETDWQTEIVTVDDGGNCYFNLKINFSSQSFYDFQVNGEG
jgi:hypothetical protein